MAENKNLEHQTLILFYWHHDSLNLFINFCSIRSHVATVVSTHNGQINDGGGEGACNIFLSAFCGQKVETKEVHKKTSTSHKP